MKASKCNFANKYTKLLGHVVTRNMIKSNQEKIDTVRLYPQSILYCPTIPSIYTILSDYTLNLYYTVRLPKIHHAN